MTTYFIHGDYHVESRNYLHTLTDQAKAAHKEIFRLDGEKITLSDLIQALASNSLFGSEKTVVIENLLSRLKSREQESMLDWLKGYQGDNDLILWEKKSIGKILQRRLPPKALVKEFKTPVLVFKLVELLSPKSIKPALETLEQTLKQEPAEFLFAMIVRQTRLLILLKTGQTVGGAPWVIGKMKKQASEFTLDQLLTSYRKLYMIDRLVKRGQTLMPLSWHLSVWVAELAK